MNSKQKILVVSFVTVFFISVVVVVGVYYFSIKSQKSELVSTLETENWQTYSNSKYSFNFKYPKDWAIYREVSDNLLVGDLVISLYPKDVLLNESNPLGKIPGIEVTVNPENPVLKGKQDDPYREDGCGGRCFYEHKNVSLNEYETHYVKNLREIYTDVDYFIYNRDRSLNFSLRSKWPGSGGIETKDYSRYIPILENIVSSVKFND